MRTPKDYLYNFGIILLLVLIVFIHSCSWLSVENAQERKITIERIDAYYGIIKTICTEPEVQDIIPPDTLLILADIERVYLVARDTATEIGAEEGEVLGNHNRATMLSCGISICDLLLDVGVLPNKKEEISGIRLILKVIKSTVVP